MCNFFAQPDALACGKDAATLPLQYLFTRRWVDPADSLAGTEELVLRRRFDVPADRSFTPFGKVRLAAGRPDEQVDAVLGLPDSSQGGITATSSGRLAGVPAARAGAAVDGDDGTAWTTPFGPAAGQWLQVTYPTPQTTSELQLLVVTDGRHSVPTQIDLRVDGGDPFRIDLPGISDLLAPLEERGVLVRRSPEQLAAELPYFTVVERESKLLACATMKPLGRGGTGEEVAEVAAFVGATTGVLQAASNGFASFLVGLGGISIAGLLIDLIRTRTSKAKGDGDAQD